jgi:hypothetical protein
MNPNESNIVRFPAQKPKPKAQPKSLEQQLSELYHIQLQMGNNTALDEEIAKLKTQIQEQSAG